MVSSKSQASSLLVRDPTRPNAWRSSDGRITYVHCHICHNLSKGFRASIVEESRIQEDGNMSAIQGKPMGEVFARERRLDSAAIKEKNTADAESTKYLRIALRLVGL